MTFPERNRLAILGFVEATLWDAPFDDESWQRDGGDEIWGLNALWALLAVSKEDFHRAEPRYDRWFEMHTRGKSDDREIDWLKKCGVSVYMLRHHDDIPQSIAFPIKDAIAHFGVNYFTNTISYELALAIMEGFREIHLYGIDMASIDNEGPPEIRDQRASIEFFLGWAMAKGIKIVIPGASDLLHTAIMYGYDEHAQSPRQKIRHLRQHYLKRAQESADSASYFRGALASLEALGRTWGDAGADEEDA